MSLLQLLTTGRSLVACDSSGRYHMSQQRLVPRFNARKDPFRTVTKTSGSAQACVVQASVSAPAPAPAISVAPQPAAVGRPAATVEPAAPAQAPARKPAAKAAASLGLAAGKLAGVFRNLKAGRRSAGQALPAAPKGADSRNWMERLMDGIWRWVNRPAKPAPAPQGIAPLSKPAVQTELSLDRVKVVRNDLSDSDLEVVPSQRPAPAPTPMPTAAAAAVAAAEPEKPKVAAARRKLVAQPAEAWGRMSSRLRMSTRLFGAGKS